MPVKKVKAPNGRVYKVNAPEGATDEQVFAFVLQQMNNQPVESQKARTFAQGLSFGFADEIEAGIRSAFSGDEYAEIRDNIRGKLKDYSEQNGGEALALEIAGSTIPSLVAQFVPVLGQSATAANVSRLATMADRMKKAAKIGAVEGAVAGAGFSESDSIGGVAGDIATGATLGGTIAPLAGEAVRKGAGLLGDLVGSTAEKLGKKGATAVEQEVRRIAKATGLSTDQIIQEAMQGRAISDNRTLAAAIRAYASKSPEAKTVFRESYDQRAPDKIKEFYSKMDQSVQGYQGNPAIQATNEFADEQQMVGKLYKQARADGKPELADSNLSQVMQAIQEVEPKLVQSVKESTEKLARLSDSPTVNDGDLMPTIEQSEQLLSKVKADIDAFYKSGGNKDIDINVYTTIRDSLQSAIDQASPVMRQARKTARQRFSAIDAYEFGQKMATKGIDEQQVLMRDLQKKLGAESLTPELMQKVREGAAFKMREPRGKRTQYSVPRNIASPDSPQSSLLDMLGVDADELGRAAQLADDTNVMRNIVDPNTGAITQMAQEESKRIGSNISPEQLLAAFSGEGAALLGIGTKLVKGMFSQELSPQQYEQVAKILVSEDPNLLLKALTDDTAMKAVRDKISDIAIKSGIIGADIGRRATAQQGAQ